MEKMLNSRGSKFRKLRNKKTPPIFEGRLAISRRRKTANLQMADFFKSDLLRYNRDDMGMTRFTSDTFSISWQQNRQQVGLPFYERSLPASFKAKIHQQNREVVYQALFNGVDLMMRNMMSSMEHHQNPPHIELWFLSFRLLQIQVLIGECFKLSESLTSWMDLFFW